MPERRKVFRVEQMAARTAPLPAGDPDSPGHKEVMRELTALRAMLAAAPAFPSDSSLAENAQVQRLVSRLRDIRAVLLGAEDDAAADAPGSPPPPMARVGHELEAAVKASEQATQKILAAAEDIDQAANNLSAVVKGDSEQGLAQDIRDRVISIFEACNFQDVTSQRLAKVKTALAGIEKSIGNALDAAPSMHGPPLDSDIGHASQSEVDLLFAVGSPALARG